MTHKTRAIVLRSIKYGETSLVVTAFTAAFGLQTYLVNGVRSSKKGSNKANLLQPAALLDLVAYHHPQKNMQRIKEFNWAVLYQQVLSQVIKNSVALYVVELLYKTIKQPEQQEDLFDFCEDILLTLDEAPPVVAANLPLFFALQLPQFLGFKIHDDYSPQQPVLDLQEGCFCADMPAHPYGIAGEDAMLIAHLLKVQQPAELQQLHLHHEVRRRLLSQLQTYYALHISDFGALKTLQVLQDVL
jgi:DNA repair protein RecO (recombination protein O)